MSALYLTQEQVATMIREGRARIGQFGNSPEYVLNTDGWRKASFLVCVEVERPDQLELFLAEAQLKAAPARQWPSPWAVFDCDGRCIATCAHAKHAAAFIGLCVMGSTVRWLGAGLDLYPPTVWREGFEEIRAGDSGTTIEEAVRIMEERALALGHGPWTQEQKQDRNRWP